MRESRLSLLILSEDELQRSTDVFPIKFLNMQRHHRVLFGKDVLSQLQIAQDFLRLRCEQEIKNLMLRLHQVYLRRAHYPEQIESILSRSVSGFIKALGVMVELKTGAIPPTKDAVVEASHELGLNVDPIWRVLALKRGQSTPGGDELKRLYAGFMHTVREAAELVDKLEGGLT